MALEEANTGEIFSIATLFYTRLRRVNGRVIDVAYFMHNLGYAQYIMELALQTKDTELCRYVDFLQQAMGLSYSYPEEEAPVVAEKVDKTIDERQEIMRHMARNFPMG